MITKRISDVYLWTFHARAKMKHYCLSESRVKRIIRYPRRIEEGIAPHCIAVMQRAETKKYQEIWAMYKIESAHANHASKPHTKERKFGLNKPKIKIITAWRYPGESPKRDPVPAEIIAGIQQFL